MNESVSEYVSQIILSDIMTSRIFSVLLDSAFDTSLKEQVSFIIMYVNENNGTVMERSLALRETRYTTRVHFSELFFKMFLLVIILIRK